MYIIGKRVKKPIFQNGMEMQRALTLNMAPAQQPTIAAARVEAQRLASLDRNHEFLIFKLVEGYQTPDLPIEVKCYANGSNT